MVTARSEPGRDEAEEKVRSGASRKSRNERKKDMETGGDRKVLRN